MRLASFRRVWESCRGPARKAARTRTLRRLGLEPLESRALLSVMPVLLRDVNPGTASSSPSGFVGSNGTTFFAASDGTHGGELWETDGTKQGTTLLKDINPGPTGSYPEALVMVGNTLFFSADDGVDGRELWKSDGTAAGTVMVKDINPGSGGSYPGGSYRPELTVVVNTLFFSANDGVHGTELWKSDGTAAGTVLVADIRPGPDFSYPENLTAVGNTLFFSADDGVHGRELWKTDGTASGTVLVKDINPGISNYGYALSSNPSYLTAVSGTLFFAANDGVHGQELWKSDGTTAGTVMVADINPGTYGSSPNNLAAVGGTLFFSADDGVHGRELWKSDGTAAGTVLVKDINPGTSGFYPFYETAVNGTLFFAAFDGVHGQQLWKSDGTAAGTVMVTDLNGGTDLFNLTAVGNQLYFSNFDSAHGQELWTSDGTASGTFLVKDINKGPASSSPRNLAFVNGALFFAANNGKNGFEPWILPIPQATSATIASGPVFVANTETGGAGSSAQDLAFVSGSSPFAADTVALGVNPWISLKQKRS